MDDFKAPEMFAAELESLDSIDDVDRYRELVEQLDRDYCKLYDALAVERSVTAILGDFMHSASVQRGERD